MTRRDLHSIPMHLTGGNSHSAHGAPDAIEKVAAKVRLGRGQSMDFGGERPAPVVLLRSGFLVVRLGYGHGERASTAFVRPGEMIWLSSYRAVGPVSIAAAETAVLLRVEEAKFEALIEKDASVRCYALQQARRHNGADQLRIALLGALRGEERLAGFLLALAAQRGAAHPSGTSLDLPVSRSDLAHHLALNPDTLSRIVTRFKAEGLIAMPDRRTFRIVDLDGLSALSAVVRKWPVSMA